MLKKQREAVAFAIRALTDGKEKRAIFLLGEEVLRRLEEVLEEDIETVPMAEYVKLQALVARQGVRLMEQEDALAAGITKDVAIKSKYKKDDTEDNS